MKKKEYFCRRILKRGHDMLIAHSPTELPPRKRKTSIKANNREVAPLAQTSP